MATTMLREQHGSGARTRATSVLVCGAMVLALLGMAAVGAPAAGAADYVPKLPKMPETTSVVVLDLTQDKSEQSWETDEALLAITTIQGIVNRTSSEKIYLVNAPQNWCGTWNPAPTDQWALDDGLVPVPMTSPALDTSKRFPVLSYLTQTYGSYLNGKVTYPSLSRTVNDSAVMAAITAAAQEDAIPLSPAMETYLEAEGTTYAQVADTRGFTSDIEAFDWALANYFQPDTTRAFVAKFGFRYWGGKPGNVPMSFDYYVASKAFIFSLDSELPAERADVSRLLNTDNYPAGTPVLGQINGEGAEIQEIQENGYFSIFVDGANYSVHSSFPSDPTAITPPKAATASPIEDNGAYVSFYVTDGDNLSISEYNHHDHWKNSPARGTVPIGWSLPPILLDIYPQKLQWLSANNYDDAYEIVANYNDGGAPYTEAGALAFTSAYKDYMDGSNGLFTTMNYFDTSPLGAEVIQSIEPDFAIRGYQGATNGNDVTWEYLDEIPSATISGVTQTNATPQEIANAVNYVVDRTPAGSPAFVVVAVGDGGHGGDPVVDAAAAVALLQSMDNGREYHFLRPADLAATWEAYTPIPSTATSYEAEDATLTGGATVYDNGQASGGLMVGAMSDGAAITFEDVVAGGPIEIRYADGSEFPGQLSLYVNGVDVATVTTPLTGSWDTFETVTVDVPVSGTVTLQVDSDDAAAMGSSSYTAGNFDMVNVIARDVSAVTPAAVTFTDEAGTDDDTYTVPVTEGVEYVVGADVVAAGTYPAAGTVTVAARATTGYVLADDATSEWTHTFGVGTDYEAEDATLTGGPTVYPNGQASGGLMVGPLYEGAAITFEDVVAGDSVDIRYANGSEFPGQLSLYVNGVDVATVTTPLTGSWDTFSTVHVDVPVSGTVTLQVDSDDAAVNGASYYTTGNFDKISVLPASGEEADVTPPEVSGVLDPSARSVTITATDDGSGVESIEYRLGDDGDWTEYTVPVVVDEEAATVFFRATDVEGNVSEVGSVDVPAVVVTRVSANAKPAAVRAGASTTLEVTVEAKKGSDAVDTAPTGTVTVRVAGQEHVATLDDGALSMALPTAGLPTGLHTVAVHYSGDSLYAAGTTTVKLNVLKPK